MKLPPIKIKNTDVSHDSKLNAFHGFSGTQQKSLGKSYRLLKKVYLKIKNLFNPNNSVANKKANLKNLSRIYDHYNDQLLHKGCNESKDVYRFKLKLAMELSGLATFKPFSNIIEPLKTKVTTDKLEALDQYMRFNTSELFHRIRTDQMDKENITTEDIGSSLITEYKNNLDKQSPDSLLFLEMSNKAYLQATLEKIIDLDQYKSLENFFISIDNYNRVVDITDEAYKECTANALNILYLSEKGDDHYNGTDEKEIKKYCQLHNIKYIPGPNTIEFEEKSIEHICILLLGMSYKFSDMYLSSMNMLFSNDLEEHAGEVEKIKRISIDQYFSIVHKILQDVVFKKNGLKNDTDEKPVYQTIIYNKNGLYFDSLDNFQPRLGMLDKKLF